MKIVDRTSDLSSGQAYSLTFDNKSSNNWSFVCFQQQPTGLPNGYVSLAWFSMPASPNTKIVFQWQIDYDFVWSQQGTLTPGVVFNASQTIPTTNGLTQGNQINFTRESNGAFNFNNQANGPSGALTITQDSTIPFNTASVGIAMSGTGTFAVPAQPNITATFIPTPTYWVGFGQNIQEGEVLDITQFAQIAEVKFGVNVYNATATLNPNNTWTIDDGSGPSVTSLVSSLRKSLR